LKQHSLEDSEKVPIAEETV